MTRAQRRFATAVVLLAPIVLLLSACATARLEVPSYGYGTHYTQFGRD